MDAPGVATHPPLLLQGVLLSTLLLGLLLPLLLWWRKASAAAGADQAAGPAAAAGGGQADAGPPKARAPIFFGTQTGTAERFAKQLRTELAARYGEGTSYEVVDLEEYKGAEQLPRERTAFFLMATYGDGEPTDNAADFYSWLLKASGEGQQTLQGLRFAVFALGNKQYEHFCMVGQRTHAALAALGATPLVAQGEGDDDEDIDADFELWRTELFAALDAAQAASGKPVGKEAAATQVVAATTSVPAYDVQVFSGADAAGAASPPAAQGSGQSAGSPYGAPVGVLRELHCACSTRSCLHMELDTRGADMPYQAGDHVGISCENLPAVVEAAAAALGADPETVLSLSVPAGNPHALSPPPFTGRLTLRTALARHVDLTGPLPKQSVQALAAFASGADAARLQGLLGPEGAAAFRAWHLQSRSLLEVLQEFPGVQPPLGAFFASIATPLQTRFYSISSSPLAHPRSVHMTCSVVREPTPTGRMLDGVASAFLGRQGPPRGLVPCFIRRSTFKLPADPATPLLMVGPGTGVAPFRGFLQERQALRERGQRLGPAYLFFGCRSRASDFLYEAELEAWAASGVLSRLFVAFSREQAHKVYVQHLLAEQGALVAPLLREGGPGVVYVCGDAKHMAKDVARALAAVLTQAEGLSTSAAEARLKALSAAGRLQRDVW